MKEFIELTAKTYSFSKDNNEEDKKQKVQKSKTKRKLSLEDYQNSLGATQLENEINNLKNEIHVYSLKKDRKESIKNNKLIKMQQRFKNERHDIFTEKI